MHPDIQHLLDRIKKMTPPNRKVLIQVSGGSDSALAFWAYTEVFPRQTVGIFFGDSLREEGWFTSRGEVRQEQAPPCITDPEIGRWARSLEIGLAESRILIGTRNKTEHELCAYSQMSRLAYHLPLVHLWKSEILALGEAVGIPETILASSREADPECGRPKELAAIPFGAVDDFLRLKIGESPQGITQLADDQRAYLESLYARNRFKYNFPLV